MRQKLLVLAVFFAMLLPISMAQADEFWYGPYTVSDYGIDEETAYLKCMDQIDAFLIEMQALLPDGYQPAGVVFLSGSWDDPEYTMEFVVFVSYRGGI